MAGRGTRATATDFNNIQSTVAAVMGLGSGQTGYGQAVASSPVAAGSLISTTQWTNIRNDMSKARQHQKNQDVVDGAASISANRGSPYQTLQILTSSTTISEDIRDQYNQFATGINAERALANTGQLSLATAPSGVTNPVNRAGNWGGASQAQSLSHSFTLTFAGYTQGSLTVSPENHARCFFNAGGIIQLTSSRSGTISTTKDTDWNNMLSGINVVNFSGTSTFLTSPGAVNAGGVVGSGTGWHNLTVGAAATTVLSQSSSISVYAENRYLISVSRPTVNTLTFTVTWQDNDIGDDTTPSDGHNFKTDETVTGTINSSIFVRRPNTANVDVPAPTATATAIA
jgi:hypothetical protein